MCGHRSAHGAEDRNRFLVLPVVDDRLQQIGIRAAGDALEEAAADETAAVIDGLEQIARLRDHVRLVEEHAAHVRMLLEDRGE